MKDKRVSFLLIVLLVFGAVLSSCAADTRKEVPSEEATTIPAEQDPLDYLPNKQFGETFDMLVRLQDVNDNYVVEQQEKPTLIQENVYYSYAEVSQRYDVDFRFTGLDGYSSGQAQFVNTILSDIQAGGTFDAVAPSYYFGVSLVIQGCYLNLKQIPVFDFSKPWWYDGFNNTLELDNSLYVCAGEFDIGHLKNTYAMIFNETILNNYQLESPYQLFEENNWTLETLLTMAEVVGDISGTGKVGLAVTRKSADCFFQGSGLRFVDKDGNGELYVSKYSDRAETLYQTLSNYIGKSSEVCKYGGSPDVDFLQGNTLFAAMTLGSMTKLIDASFDYGAMVYPKYDSEQNAYYSTTAGSSVFALIKTTPDTEMSATVLEALCAYFHEKVTPAIFENLMQGRVARKPEMASMLETIRDTLFYDFGFVWSASLGNVATFTSFIESGSYESMSTWYQAIGGGYEIKLDEFLTSYEKIPEKLRENSN